MHESHFLNSDVVKKLFAIFAITVCIVTSISKPYSIIFRFCANVV